MGPIVNVDALAIAYTYRNATDVQLEMSYVVGRGKNNICVMAFTCGRKQLYTCFHYEVSFCRLLQLSSLPVPFTLLRVTHSKVLSARNVGVFKYEELCSYQVTSWNERTLQSMLACEGVAFAVAFVMGVRLQGKKGYSEWER